MSISGAVLLVVSIIAIVTICKCVRKELNQIEPNAFENEGNNQINDNAAYRGYGFSKKRKEDTYDNVYINNNYSEKKQKVILYPGVPSLNQQTYDREF